MAKDIYIPGLTSAKKDKEGIARDEAAMLEIRRDIADAHVDEKEQRSRDIKAILADVAERCRNLEGPIEITEDMIDLGIADDVKRLVAQYDLAAPFLRVLQDREDSDWWD